MNRPNVIKGDNIAMRPFTESLPMALLEARENTMRLFRPMLAQHDLTEQQWRVLRALTATPDSLEVAELASRTNLLAPSLSRILANLETRALVERATVAHDQRRAEISLTRKGVRLVAKIAPHSEASYEALEEAFGKRELAALLDALHRLSNLSVASHQLAEEAS